MATDGPIKIVFRSEISYLGPEQDFLDRLAKERATMERQKRKRMERIHTQLLCKKAKAAGLKVTWREVLEEYEARLIGSTT